MVCGVKVTNNDLKERPWKIVWGLVLSLSRMGELRTCSSQNITMMNKTKRGERGKVLMVGVGE